MGFFSVLGGTASRARRKSVGVEGRSSSSDNGSFVGEDQVTVFFLIALIVERSHRARGRKKDMHDDAYDILLRLLSVTVKCEEPEMTMSLTDVLFATPFQKNQSTLFPVSHHLPARDHKEFLTSLGVELDDDSAANVKDPSFCLDSYFVFKLLLEKGSLPLECILALAAFVEDGISLGHGITEYQESQITRASKRQKVTRADKACAFERILANPADGVMKHIQRPESSQTTSFFNRSTSHGNLTTQEPGDVNDPQWLRESQLCPSGKKPNTGKKTYKGVHDEGAALM